MNKQIVVDPEYIENINYAMIMALECESKMFKKELVLEDGRVTQVHTEYKIVKGE